jgi:putative ABC transport system permease protein
MFRAVLHIALRNLVKNRRRSSATVLAIAFGFAALTLFRGYTSDVYRALRDSAVFDEGLGHLTIAKRGFREYGSLAPERYLLDERELQRVLQVARAHAHVLLASPKLHVAGQVSAGPHAKIFIGEGVVPEDYSRLQAQSQRPRRPLDAKRSFAVELGRQLAKQLGLHAESDVVLSVVTIDGQLNAADARVLRSFDTGVPDTNDKLVRMPLALAQELYDTHGADRVTVLLDGVDAIEPVRRELSTQLAAAGIAVEIQDWQELSSFYANTNDMLGMLFTFMASIVLTVVLMSIVNTTGMAVLERTREIGTLRALGLQTRGALALFATEGALLGLFGSVIGCALHTLGWATIRAVRMTYTPPGFADPVPFVVRYVPDMVFATTLLMVVISLLAALGPAMRAANQNIVQSLGDA